jgi:hypothetical protein
MVFKELHQFLDLDLYLLLVVVMVDMVATLHLVLVDLVDLVVVVVKENLLALEPIFLVRLNKDILEEQDMEALQIMAVVAVEALVVLVLMQHQQLVVLGV